MKNILFFLIALLNYSLFAQSSPYYDKIPIIIKGKKYYLKNKDDNRTPYYYLFVTQDRNEVYDIRTKKTLWSRPIVERPYRPLWKKLPKKRKYKVKFNNKTYYKYFKNDSIILLTKIYNKNHKLKKIYGFHSFDSLSQTSINYYLKSGKIYSGGSLGGAFITGWDYIPYDKFVSDSYKKRKIPIDNNANFKIHTHRIVRSNCNITDVPEQTSYLSDYQGYKQLSKVETDSKNCKFIVPYSEENLKDKFIIFFNPDLRKFYIKHLKNNIKIDQVIIVKRDKTKIKTFKSQDFYDVSYLSKGIYYITIKSGNKRIVSFMLNLLSI